MEKKKTNTIIVFTTFISIFINKASSWANDEWELRRVRSIENINPSYHEVFNVAEVNYIK